MCFPSHQSPNVHPGTRQRQKLAKWCTSGSSLDVGGCGSVYHARLRQNATGQTSTLERLPPSRKRNYANWTGEARVNWPMENTTGQKLYLILKALCKHYNQHELDGKTHGGSSEYKLTAPNSVFLLANMMGTTHEISLFTTFCHGCKGKKKFATVTNGCKERNFTGFSHEYGILDTFFLKVSQKI